MIYIDDTLGLGARTGVRMSQAFTCGSNKGRQAGWPKEARRVAREGGRAGVESPGYIVLGNIM